MEGVTGSIPVAPTILSPPLTAPAILPNNRASKAWRRIWRRWCNQCPCGRPSAGAAQACRHPRQGNSTAKFRTLVHEIAQLICYEVTRDLPTEMVEVENAPHQGEISKIAGKKLVFAPILGGRACPCSTECWRWCPPPVLPISASTRPRDAAAGRILLQGPERSRRPPDHRG